MHNYGLQHLFDVFFVEIERESLLSSILTVISLTMIVLLSME